MRLTDIFDPAVAYQIFKADGRIPRSTYWLGTFGVMLSLNCLGFMIQASGTAPTPVTAGAALAILYGWCVLIIRRGHDFNAPGWIVLPLVMALSMATTVNLGSSILGAAINITAFVVLGSLRGDATRNQYGPAMVSQPWPASRDEWIAEMEASEA